MRTSGDRPTSVFLRQGLRRFLSAKRLRPLGEIYFGSSLTSGTVGDMAASMPDKDDMGAAVLASRRLPA
jgi:hypothetical protein